jgi:hypothetical protein
MSTYKSNFGFISFLKKHLNKDNWLTYHCILHQDNLAAVSEFWNIVPEQLKISVSCAHNILCLFGSTYICEMTFCMMKVIKGKYRSCLTNANQEKLLQDCAEELLISSFNVKDAIICINCKYTYEITRYYFHSKIFYEFHFWFFINL